MQVEINNSESISNGILPLNAFFDPTVGIQDLVPCFLLDLGIDRIIIGVPTWTPQSTVGATVDRSREPANPCFDTVLVHGAGAEEVAFWRLIGEVVQYSWHLSDHETIYHQRWDLICEWNGSVSDTLRWQEVWLHGLFVLIFAYSASDTLSSAAFIKPPSPNFITTFLKGMPSSRSSMCGTKEHAPSAQYKVVWGCMFEDSLKVSLTRVYRM